jgi:hypothetical protein
MPIAPFESDFARGARVVGGILGPAGQDIQAAIDRDKMNKVANQLMSQQLNTTDPPRAALVAPGVNAQGQANVIAPGTNIAGSSPQVARGGLTELTLRDKVQEQQIINQLRASQAQMYQAKAQNFLQPDTTPALTPFQQLEQQHWQAEQQRLQGEADQKKQDELTKSVKSWQDKNAKTLGTLADDVDTKYGKGAAEDFFNSWSTGTMGRGNPDPKNPGSYIYNPNGQFYYTNPVVDNSDPQNPKVVKPARAIKTFEFEDLLSQKKAIEDAGGRLVPAPKAAAITDAQGNPVIGQPPSTNQPAVPTANPKPLTALSPAEIAKLPHPLTPAEFAAIPSGTQMVDRDGIPKIKP